MENPSTGRTPPNIVNRTVTPRRPKNADVRPREYLTAKEVERLEEAVRRTRATVTGTLPPSSSPIATACAPASFAL